jgi:hypothetical protein
MSTRKATLLVDSDMDTVTEAGSELKLSMRERRDMGLTIPAMVKAAKKLKKAGALSSDPDIAASQILNELIAANPKAFAKPGIDWEGILAFIEKLLPIILKFISIFGGL